MLLLPEFTLLPFAGFLDKLRLSADQADFSQQQYCQWTISALEQSGITSSCGATVLTTPLDHSSPWPDTDFLVIFGGRNIKLLLETADSYRPLLKKALHHGVKLVSIDNACFLLAKCGLLQRKTVAVHWRHQHQFAQLFPAVKIATEHSFVHSGNLLSCVGGTVAIDVAIEVLTETLGHLKATKGLPDMFVENTRPALHRFKQVDAPALTDRVLLKAISLMQYYLGKKIQLNDIARLAGCSRRQLDRKMQEQFQKTSHQYLLELRLQQARWQLLNSSLSLATIAAEIGLSDPAYLQKLFKKHFGISPAKIRQQQK